MVHQRAIAPSQDEENLPEKMKKKIKNLYLFLEARMFKDVGRPRHLRMTLVLEQVKIYKVASADV